MSIIAVQFQSKKTPGEFSGREYNYFSNVELSVGDIIIAPTAKGQSAVRVCRVNVADSEISDHVRPYMQTITEIVRPDEPREGSMHTAVMKQWSLTSNQSGFTAPELLKYYLRGNIHEDSRKAFEDGHLVDTSSIRKVEDCGTHKLVYTRNTAYTVRPEDVDPGYEEAFPGAYERLAMIARKEAACENA